MKKINYNSFGRAILVMVLVLAFKKVEVRGKIWMSIYRVVISREGEEKTIRAAVGTSLLSVLAEQGVYMTAACGGNGCCGKCKVRLVSGVTKATEADRKFFNEEQLAQGMRLACEAYPTEDCRVVIESGDEADFEIVAEYRGKLTGTGDDDREPVQDDMPMQRAGEDRKSGEACAEADNRGDGARYDIAIDVGTTTIAAALVSCVDNTVCKTVAEVNHQRAYGADVISRIQAANEGKLGKLSDCIRKDLYGIMQKLLEESGKDFSRIRRISVAGNTTMQHLLMGYPCETLGMYPFEPVNISLTHAAFSELFADAAKDFQTDMDSGTGSEEVLGHSETGKGDIDVVLLPGISTYVGADIAAGLLACGFDRAEEINVLIDLGTNGEMAIGNRDKILVTSTAAGPAFEGGNISCGMGSVRGAICEVEINGTDVRCTTIGGKAPMGLCGTGVIETVSELLKEEWIDETGMLDEDFFDNGFVLARTPKGEDIVFTQKDVREIQLAKSAVRAGLETLLLRYGVTYDEIGTLYLAGGFGFRMNLAKAAAIGLLPEVLLDKTVAVGNSSLEGAVEFLADDLSAARMKRLIQIAEEVPLASDKDFNRLYTDYMFFE